MENNDKGESWLGTILLICLAIAVIVFPSFRNFAQNIFGVLMWPLLIVFFGFVFWLKIYGPYMSATEPDRILKRQQRKEAEEARLKEIKHQKQIAQKEREKLQAEKWTQYEQLLSEIRKLPRYQTWRNEVFNKLGHICGHCGSLDNLEVHHLKTKSFSSIIKRNSISNTFQAVDCLELWDVNIGLVLCSPCHKEMESSKQRAELIKNY